MPRGKRKSIKENQTTITKKAKVEKSSETRHKKDDISKPFSVKLCRVWFEEYADEPDVIGPDGIQKLCKDLHVDPENIVMLVIAWKLNAENLGFFKFSEWYSGMVSMQCDSTKKLQSKLKSLKSLIDDPVIFKKIYRYAFDFCRNKDQRNLDINMAKEMLEILLKGSWTLLEHFIEFIELSDYKVINKDQWCNVLEFYRTVKSDLSNYDVNGAWPVMLDEFVEWFSHRRKAT